MCASPSHRKKKMIRIVIPAAAFVLCAHRRRSRTPSCTRAAIKLSLRNDRAKRRRAIAVLLLLLRFMRGACVRIACAPKVNNNFVIWVRFVARRVFARTYYVSRLFARISAWSEYSFFCVCVCLIPYGNFISTAVCDREVSDCVCVYNIFICICEKKCKSENIFLEYMCMRICAMQVSIVAMHNMMAI